MKIRLTILFVLLSWPLLAEPTEIMYYKFFGEYLVEKPYNINVEVENLSLFELKQILQKQRAKNDAINADLVVIGYGDEGEPEEFFAASNNVDSRVPLKHLLSSTPERSPDAHWQIYFIDRYISGYVRARKDHHWASPFRWLAHIGLQDLTYVDEKASLAFH